MRSTSEPLVWARVENVTRGVTISKFARVAATRKQRMRGLLHCTAVEEEQALVILRCRSVHTWGMRFPLDLLFWDKRGTVLRAIESLPPGRLSPLVWRARGVMELLPGMLAMSGTRVGDRISVGIFGDDG